MTKKKALVYLIIFIISVSAAFVWKKLYLKDLTAEFPDVCKVVIEPACQNYLMDISAKGKYEEAAKIQKVRITENTNILNFYRKKVTNKCLLNKCSADADKILQEIAKSKDQSEFMEKSKLDIFIFSAADFTIRDIVTDSVAVAEIELKEFKDPASAEKTLKNAKKILLQNPYFLLQEAALKLVEQQLSQIEKK